MTARLRKLLLIFLAPWRIFELFERYDIDWDTRLNALLDQGYPPTAGYLTTSINGTGIWIGNYPYAYGHMYSSGKESGMPSKATKLRLRKYIRDHNVRIRGT